MKLEHDLKRLTEKELYTVALFALYKLNESPEYSSLSQLVYVLDKSNLLKLCQIFGGQTITIPTISELEEVIYAIWVNHEISANGKSYEDVKSELSKKDINLTNIMKIYEQIKELLGSYTIVGDSNDK